MNERPLGTFRVTWIVSALTLRRFANRLNAFRRRGRGRAATGRKATAGKTLLGFLALMMAFQGVLFSGAALTRAAHVAEQSTAPGFLFVHSFTLAELDELAEAGACHHTPLDFEHQRRLDRVFSLEGSEHRDPDDRAEYQAFLRHKFDTECLEPFRGSQVVSGGLFPSTRAWFRGAGELAMPKALMGFGLLFMITAVLQTVAGVGRDLTDVDQRFEWLFSFPVRPASLFLARMLAMALTAPLIWVLLWPFFACVYVSAGFGTWGIALGAAVALGVGVMGGSLRVLAETTLPRLLSQATVGRVQAVFGLLGTLTLIPAIALAYTPGLGFLYERALALPDAALYTPFTAPLSIAAGGETAVRGGLAALAWVLGTALVSVLVAARMVARGVVVVSGVEPGRRGFAPVPASEERLGLRGIARKELRALLRDRQLRTQAFVTPVLVVAVQLLLNPRLVHSLGSNPRYVATAAFGTGAFSLLTGAVNGLATEGQALWTLYTAPVRLERLLLSKVHVWVGVASVFATVALVVLLGRSPALIPASLWHLPLVFAGVYLYAVIGIGLGALGTDPFEHEPRRRLRAGATYVFMLLLSLFGYALYSSSLWAKFVELILSALLAYALWQKLKDHLPYLLDPTEAPPPSIGVADGVLAALAFFAFQGVFMLIFRSDTASLFATLTLAFAAAGVAVTVASLWYFERSKVPELTSALGLVPPRGRSRAFEPYALGLGIAAGGLAALFGLGYRKVVLAWPALQDSAAGDLIEGHVLGSGERVWLTGLAVVAAPLFEEFIFRGILYRGFRRSFTAPLAAFMSAVVFALVHPAASALPVFVMAFLAALVYERFRWLLVPIATHVTYNAVMVGTALWLH